MSEHICFTYIWSKMLSSSLDPLLKVSKTTFPQKLFAYDCVTLYISEIILWSTLKMSWTVTLRIEASLRLKLTPESGVTVHMNVVLSVHLYSTRRSCLYGSLVHYSYTTWPEYHGRVFMVPNVKSELSTV